MIGRLDTQDSLAVIRELPEERTDTPRRLRVETGRGLVEEEEQLGLRNKLDTNREALTLLDVQTFSGYTDNRISIFLREKGQN